jgi:hypothetical protein
MPSRAGRPCLRSGCPERLPRTGYCRVHGQTVVHLVLGAPCSGKSTFVRERARPGDLVLDWDVLAAALSGVSGHRHPPQVHGYVAAARDAVLARLCQRRGEAEPPAAWIIATNAPPLGDLSPRVHVLDTPAEECVRRLRADPDGRDVVAVERVIRAYRPPRR